MSCTPRLVFVKVNLHFTHVRLPPFSGFAYVNLLKRKHVRC